MSDPYGEKNIERGLKAAFSFGAEFEANQHEWIGDYKDSFAFYMREGVESFSELTAEEKRKGMAQFRAGRDAEKKLNQ